LDQLRQADAPALAEMFEGARPVSIDREGSTVTIGFPPTSTFNKRKAEAAEKREQMAAALEAVAGERLGPVYVLLDGEAEPQAPPVDERADEEAWVERVKSEVNAEGAS
jgi:hypothetical protein